MSDPRMELGRRNYNAYMKEMRYVAARLGSELRPKTWEELPSEEQQGWVRAAEAVLLNPEPTLIERLRTQAEHASGIGCSGEAYLCNEAANRIEELEKK